MKMKFVHTFSFCITTAILISNVNSLESESIIGGNPGNNEDFKYQVSIFMDKSLECGGGIISNNHVLTAAHCFIKGNKFVVSRWYVLAGTAQSNRKKGKLVEVEKIYVRKGYHLPRNTDEPGDDIAVLKLKSGLGINGKSNIDKLTLPPAGQSYDNVGAVISGFGYTQIETRYDPKLKMKVETNGRTDYNLKYAQANVIPIQECGKKYDISFHESYMCARVKQRGRFSEGVCSGDSGGPLVYNDNIVIGILSNSATACSETDDNVPGIYTRVSYYRSFIQNAVNGQKTDDMRIATIKTKKKIFKSVTTIEEE